LTLSNISAVALPVAETCNSAPETGIDDITSFFGLSFLPIGGICNRVVKMQGQHRPGFCFLKVVNENCK